jgi:hypothetical protein
MEHLIVLDYADSMSLGHTMCMQISRVCTNGVF